MIKADNRRDLSGLSTFLVGLQNWNPDEELNLNLSDSTEAEKEFIKWCIQAKKGSAQREGLLEFTIFAQLDDLFLEDISEEECQERTNKLLREFLNMVNAETLPDPDFF